MLKTGLMRDTVTSSDVVIDDGVGGGAGAGDAATSNDSTAPDDQAAIHVASASAAGAGAGAGAGGGGGDTVGDDGEEHPLLGTTRRRGSATNVTQDASAEVQCWSAS